MEQKNLKTEQRHQTENIGAGKILISSKKCKTECSVSEGTGYQYKKNDKGIRGKNMDENKEVTKRKNYGARKKKKKHG